MAFQIGKSIKTFANESEKILITGGGAYNDFLIDNLKSELSTYHHIEIPTDDIINYKEAMIFAFLGVLRLRNEPNCLSSVTGATKDSSGGVFYYP